MPGRELKPGQTQRTEMEPLIDANAAARLLGLHPVTVCEFARKGIIPAIKIGRVWRFRPSSLQRWLDEQERKRQQLA
jgi:excisionase family DNA binding protein